MSRSSLIQKLVELTGDTNWWDTTAKKWELALAYSMLTNQQDEVNA